MPQHSSRALITWLRRHCAVGRPQWGILVWLLLVSGVQAGNDVQTMRLVVPPSESGGSGGASVPAVDPATGAARPPPAILRQAPPPQDPTFEPAPGTPGGPSADASTDPPAASPAVPPLPPSQGFSPDPSPVTVPGSLIGRGLPGVQPVPAGAVDEESMNHEAREIIAISASMEAAQELARQLAAERIVVRGRFMLSQLGMVVTRFRVPADTLARQWLPVLREASPDVHFDLNHRYRLQAEDVRRYAHRMVAAGDMRPGCGNGVRLGMMDTGVDEQHPALHSQRVQQRSFLRGGEQAAPVDHGTAVAALLVGDPQAGALAGLVPGAELRVAAVFRERKGSVEVTVVRLLRALDYLLQQQVQLINFSLAGPENRLLGIAIDAAAQAGVAVIAAVGNAGADAPVQYPAAWPSVLAVTAVDADLRPYARASRGEEVDLAAPGVDVWVARAGGEGVFVSGTSYAAPVVSALLAQWMAANPGKSVSQGVDALRRKARDLGAPGRDPVFGAGLVQALVAECK